MKNDDLFAETSMSFGEHLEELRLCFIKSFVSIALGTLLGFAVGPNVVEYIQIPVQRSLDTYQRQQSIHKLVAESDMLQEEGYSHEVITVLEKYHIIPEERWIFPGELERVLNRQRALANESTAGTELDSVDNLLLRKIERQKKREDMGLIYDTVHLDEAPIRLLFFKKTDDLYKTKALGVYEAFKIYLIASMVVGLVIASPFVTYYLWSFVAAGLYPHEKKYVYYFIPISILLFVGGALFAFFVVFQFVLDFLFFFNAWMNIEPDPRISEWISFALLFPLGFGISFQLPLVMFVLERVGIFSLLQYLQRWRIAVLVIFVLALFLTPGDPGSMLLMAVPLTVLYFGGIFFCWLIPRKRGLFDIDPEDTVA